MYGQKTLYGVKKPCKFFTYLQLCICVAVNRLIVISFEYPCVIASFWPLAMSVVLFALVWTRCYGILPRSLLITGSLATTG